jgi:hypothetical protein
MLKILKRLGRRGGRVESGALGVAPGVTTSEHGDGVIFLHTGTGSVYTANATGARIFEALRRGGTPEAIGAALGAELGAPAEIVAADAARFAGELAAQGILVRVRAA